MRSRSGKTLLALSAVVASGLATAAEHGHAPRSGPPGTSANGTTTRPAEEALVVHVGSEHLGPEQQKRGAGLAAGCDLSGRHKPLVALPNDIEGELTLDDANDYLIAGSAHVHERATLVVPKCTRLEGSLAPHPGVLVVRRGGRLVALGTPEEPILFTSASGGGGRAGQWGGVVLLGRAPISASGGARESSLLGLAGSAYGGAAPADDSGTLQYVRIEFAGRSSAGEPQAALTLAGVGSGTTLDHIMLSNVEGDCVRWSGGRGEASHLVCNNPGDDFFAIGEGTSLTGAHWFGRRLPSAHASAHPNGIECSGGKDDGSSGEGLDVAHVTLCGIAEDSPKAEPSRALVLTDRVAGVFDDVTALGFDFGIDVRGSFAADDVALENSAFFELGQGLDEDALEFDDEDDDGGTADGAWFSAQPSNRLDPEPSAFTSEDCLAPGGPAPRVFHSGIGAFTGGATWITGAWLDWGDE